MQWHVTQWHVLAMASTETAEGQQRHAMQQHHLVESITFPTHLHSVTTIDICTQFMQQWKAIAQYHLHVSADVTFINLFLRLIQMAAIFTAKRLLSLQFTWSASIDLRITCKHREWRPLQGGGARMGERGQEGPKTLQKACPGV